MPNEFESQPNQEVGATDQEKLDQFRELMHTELREGLPKPELMAKLEEIDFENISEFSDSSTGYKVVEVAFMTKGKADRYSPEVTNHRFRSIFLSKSSGGRYNVELKNDGIVEGPEYGDYVHTQVVHYTRSNDQEWKVEKGIRYSMFMDEFEKLGFKLEHIKK